MFLIQQDIYANTLTDFADIVLPAATWGEVDFTRAQGERRLRIYSKFYDPPGEAKPDWWIMAQIAKKMGYEGFDFEGVQRHLRACLGAEIEGRAVRLLPPGQGGQAPRARPATNCCAS